MTVHKKVLIAIDLEGQPEQVLKGASRFIDSSTEVEILTVAFDPTYMYASYGAGGFVSGIPVPNTEDIKAQAQATLQALIDASDFKDALARVEVGRASDVIVNEAEALEADLVVVGSHGRHGIGLLLGSTANVVLHRAKCDVLAVRILNNKNL